MARRRFFVDEIHHRQATVTGDEAQHLRQVLRAQLGQRYELSDGNRVFLAEITEFRKGIITFDIVDEIPQPPDLLNVVLAVALIKFDRMELLIEKATELGVSRIECFIAIRSDRGLIKAVPKRMERWRRIAAEAAKQCHRVQPPGLMDLSTWGQVLAPTAGLRLFLDEAGRVPFLRGLPPVTERTQGATVNLLLGPEGGWDPREREQAVTAGFSPLSLGRNILRAETAATAALAALQLAWEEAQPPAGTIS